MFMLISRHIITVTLVCLLSGCDVSVENRTPSTFDSTPEDVYPFTARVKRGLLVYSLNTDVTVDGRRQDMTSSGGTIWRYDHAASCKLSVDFFYDVNYYWLMPFLPTSEHKRFPSSDIIRADIVRQPSLLELSGSDVAVGDTIQFNATVKDASGCDLDSANAGWSSDDPNIASVDASGVVRGESLGSTTIHASAASINGSAPVIVYAQGNDKIALQNNIGNDNAVVLLDGKQSSGCVSDGAYRGSTGVDVDNVLPSNDCSSEVVVMSDGNALEIVSPVSLWTEATGDQLTVDLKDPLSLPLRIWSVHGDHQLVQQKAEAALTWANVAFGDSHAGIIFPAEFTDKTGDADPAKSYAYCNLHMDIVQDIGYEPGKLNVYYVDRVLEASPTSVGVWCGTFGVGGIILMENTAPISILAHELGHALSLEHVDAVDLDADGNSDFEMWTNVMSMGSDPVITPTFTEGQAFRVNANELSFLNAIGVRRAVTRNCAEGDYNRMCPAVTLDLAND
jgi:hypothetical protein